MKHEKTQRKHRYKENSNTKKILSTLFLIVMICIFMYSSYHVFVWLKNDKDTKKLEEGLYSEVVLNNEENGNDDKGKKETTQIDFQKLTEINSDIFAWIKIENTYINYPILQGETDEYYLRKDIYKKYSLSGSIFVDTDTKTDFTNDNTIIYGHNIKNQRMFADLHKIYDGELGKDVFVEIFTEKNEKYKYKVFSAYIAVPDKDIIQKKFTKKQKETYIKNALDKSNIKFDVEIDNSKEIITLVTCDDTNEKRLIVNAIKQ